MEQHNVFSSISQDGQILSQQLSTTSTSIEAILKRLQTDLLTAQTTEIGRPARYYKAYKAYTKAYGIEVLEKLSATCLPIEREKVSDLLRKYNDYNPET